MSTIKIYNSQTSQWEYIAVGREGPTGPTGPQGDIGATGPAGPTWLTAQEVSSNITLEAGYRYFVDTSAARTLTLPASPSVGDEVQIFDATNTAASNNITVNNNSSKINGQLDTLLVDANGAAVILVYTGSTLGWRV